MPDHEELRRLLREQWHLGAAEISARPGGALSRAYQVRAGTDGYVVRVVEPSARQPLEAGLAAAEHLGRIGVTVGAPVRTLGGALTAGTDLGAVAVLRQVPGRPLSGADPVDQQWWGDRLGAVHGALQTFVHPGLRPWSLLDPDGAHLDVQRWLRPAVADAVAAAVRLTVTDRLTYGVLHGDPAPQEFVVDPDTGRAGLTDCGASGTGPLVYDVAAAVDYAGGPQHAAELVDGYLAAGPVGPDELHAALPVLLRLRWAVGADHSARRVAAGVPAPGDADVLRRARVALESAPG